MNVNQLPMTQQRSVCDRERRIKQATIEACALAISNLRNRDPNWAGPLRGSAWDNACLRATKETLAINPDDIEVAHD